MSMPIVVLVDLEKTSSEPVAPMRKHIALFGFVAVCSIAISQLAVSQDSANKPATQPQEMPAWMVRGLPGPGHRALDPLIGTWKVRMNIHGTFGRDPDAPPIISEDLLCHREWVPGGRYLEDTMQGTAAGGTYWRRGWLGYSNMDRRYEWVTIDAVNSTMMSYAGAPGSGSSMPITMSGVFTDQGVAGESAVGKSVPMRTVIKIENNDRHVFELYFTPPGKGEVLATRTVYTRVKE
jgi:hypothetical protein